MRNRSCWGQVAGRAGMEIFTVSLPPTTCVYTQEGSSCLWGGGPKDPGKPCVTRSTLNWQEFFCYFSEMGACVGLRPTEVTLYFRTL